MERSIDFQKNNEHTITQNDSTEQPTTLFDIVQDQGENSIFQSMDISDCSEENDIPEDVKRKQKNRERSKRYREKKKKR